MIYLLNVNIHIYRCYCVPDYHGRRCQYRLVISFQKKNDLDLNICEGTMNADYLQDPSVSMEEFVWMMLTGLSVNVRMDSLEIIVSALEVRMTLRMLRMSIRICPT